MLSTDGRGGTVLVVGSAEATRTGTVLATRTGIGYEGGRGGGGGGGEMSSVAREMGVEGGGVRSTYGRAVWWMEMMLGLHVVWA